MRYSIHCESVSREFESESFTFRKLRVFKTWFFVDFVKLESSNPVKIF